MASSSSSSSAAAGYALAATAMALSGSLVLFSLRRAKPPHPDCSAEAPRLRPCLSSSEKRKREKARRGSIKRVRFADDVVDNGAPATPARAPARAAAPVEPAEPSCGSVAAAAAAAQLRTAAMPANREALYRGMLRDRSMLRVACSY